MNQFIPHRNITHPQIPNSNIWHVRRNHPMIHAAMPLGAHRSALKVLLHTTPRYPAEICWISPTGSAGEGPEIQTRYKLDVVSTELKNIHNYNRVSPLIFGMKIQEVIETTAYRYSSFYLVVIENNCFVLISHFSGIPSLKPTQPLTIGHPNKEFHLPTIDFQRLC